MSPTDFLGLPLAIQVALGAGYLAYVVAYGGIRDHHSAADTVFLTLAFGIPPGLIMGWAGEGAPALAAALAVGTALGLAALWRKWGRWGAHELLRLGRVHTDDGLRTAWSALINTTRPMGQIDVHLTNGHVLRCTNLARYKSAAERGVVLGSDGSIVMVVELDDHPGGRTEMPGVVDPVAGTRLTYIPAGEVARVDLRIE